MSIEKAVRPTNDGRSPNTKIVSTLSLYIRARVTLEDTLEAMCRLAAHVEPEDISQFDIDRLARAVRILQHKLDERNGKIADTNQPTA